MPIKRPTESDFEVQRLEATVVVNFKPTRSEYTFYLLADPTDIARQGGPVSKPPLIRHAETGDTGEYPSAEVDALATKLAEKAMKP
jgi:hypothetical protein